MAKLPTNATHAWQSYQRTPRMPISWHCHHLPRNRICCAPTATAPCPTPPICDHAPPWPVHSSSVDTDPRWLLLLKSASQTQTGAPVSHPVNPLYGKATTVLLVCEVGFPALQAGGHAGDVILLFAWHVMRILCTLSVVAPCTMMC
jgi:hypothetical protein